MSTTRERREARAERLREWSAGREEKGAAASAQAAAIADMIPFGQPILVGHHSEGRARRDQARIESGMRAGYENQQKAEEMARRADNIEKMNAAAIYTDDEDAAERLTAKIEAETAKRDRMKTANAEFRKANKEALKGKTAYERSCALPYAGYEITNLTANIGRMRKRLEGLGAARERQAAGRIITARFAGKCADCGAGIEQGQQIRYSRADGARCTDCGTEG